MAKLARKKKFKPYPSSDPCPCKSGLAYEKCCKNKKFKFQIDDKGKVYKRLKFHPRLNETLVEAQREFQKIFGRKPEGRDPVVFNHWLNGDEDFWQQARTIGRSANLPEQFIFAWRRSGFLVGEHSRDLMPESEYQEWTDAIKEYFAIEDDGFDPFHVFTYLSGEEYEYYKALVEKFDSVIIAMGFALTEPRRFISEADYFRYLFIRRSLNSLRTIREMYHNRYDGDCLSITRTLYEAYLRMKLLRLNPSSAERFEAALGYQANLYVPKLKKNGKPNFEIVIDPKTGKEFRISISNREIIEISDFQLEDQLYSELYPLLSGFVHPDLMRVAVTSASVDPREKSTQEDPIQSAIVISLVCMLFLLETVESTFLRKKTRRDIQYVLDSVGEELFKLVISETVLKRGTAPLSLYNFLGLDVRSREKSQPSGSPY